MVTTPRPVELLIGETKRPSVLRAPIVTMRTAAAANVTTTAGLLQPVMGPDYTPVHRSRLQLYLHGALVAAALAVEALGLGPGELLRLDAVDAHPAVRHVVADDLNGALHAGIDFLPLRTDRGICGFHMLGC